MYKRNPCISIVQFIASFDSFSQTHYSAKNNDNNKVTLKLDGTESLCFLFSLFFWIFMQMLSMTSVDRLNSCAFG